MEKNKEAIRPSTWIIVGIAVIFIAGYFGYQIYQGFQQQKIVLENANKQQQDLLSEQQKELDQTKQQISDMTGTQKAAQTAAEEAQKKATESQNLAAEAQKKLQTEQNNSPDLASIIAEWRPKTAYVFCSWKDNAGQAYQAVSGSGFLAALSSGIQIITNKHVVVDPQYGVATVCLLKFPDDGSASYHISSSDNSITVDSNGYDVGYITSSMAPFGNVSKTLSQRAGSFFNSCSQAPNIGDPVVVIGYPDYGTGSIFQNIKSVDVTATEGIISGLGNGYYTTSAKIEHGNSGGLAIDEKRDCYLGIPSAAVVGEIESLGRILPVSLFLR